MKISCKKLPKSRVDIARKSIPYTVFCLMQQMPFQLAFAESLETTQTQDAQFKQLLACEHNAADAQTKAECSKRLTADKAGLSEMQIAQLRADMQFQDSKAVVIAQAPVVKSKPTITNAIVVDQAIINTAEVTDTNPAGVSETPAGSNKINTPNKSLDSKALNAKEGKGLPLGNKDANGKETNIELQQINVRAKRFYEVGPLPGLGLTKEEIPGNVQSISAKEIKESHSLSLTDLLNKKLQSVNVNDYQGNPFQMDVTYRGFTAGPQIGTPQGLSVFLDGIRVNEPFGDVVNWDLIPMNAIAGVDVFPGSNPIFGLNTLGGAFTLKTKDGFSNEGMDAEVLTGSYGRKQLQAEAGWNNGTVALFGAGNFFLEDGWRDNSPSKVNQFFGKGSYRGDKLDLSLSTLLVKTDLVGNGLLPSEEYARDPSSVYTSPDTTKNKLAQFQLSGSFFVDDNFTVTGQAYRRKSNRHAIGADAYTDYPDDLYARRLPAAGEQYTCIFSSTGEAAKLGIPDYYVIPVVADPNFGPDVFGTQFVQDYFANGRVLTAADNPINNYDAFKNTVLPDYYAKALQSSFNGGKNLYESAIYNVNSNVGAGFDGPQVNYSFGQQKSYQTGGALFVDNINGYTGAFGGPNDNLFFESGATGQVYYDVTTPAGTTRNYVFLTSAINNDVCAATKQTNVAGGNNPGGNAYTYTDPKTGNGAALVDGFAAGQPGVASYTDPATGKQYYTPTAIINDNEIDQVVDGASLQLNWNLEHHKFMVGASIDAASADYSNTSQLGFLDANRKAYLDPSIAHPQFLGAFQPISNNNFEGTNTTKSLYFSETWSPVEAWHFNASGRYNDTQGKNKIKARYGNAQYDIGSLASVPDFYNVCTDVNGDGKVDMTDCAAGNVPLNYRTSPKLDSLLPAETEKFSYYSFNPSLGATWQAKENLNLFANWAKGTRTPSVIELGCAFDKTPVNTSGSSTPKSIFENRQCTLPTTLSGDPYLPQIKATTYDIGARGTWGDSLQWNVGAYQTDLKDDIYFVAAGGGGAGFFDTIGKTRRRGLEAGLSGKKDKWGFSLNYGLTDATFQDNVRLISNDNSSATDKGDGYGYTIDVKPGNRMPGVPLHNLNASISYEVTPQWQVGFSAVVHSESFVRGNENNEHKKGVIQRTVDVFNPTTGVFERFFTQPTNNPGTVPGYATFNFQTSYKFNREWTATMLISNLFDKEYFSAGRLGRNPFSPSINGAIGPDGYNHNSGDWLSTNFIAPGAPRGIWVSVDWHFDPNQK